MFDWRILLIILAIVVVIFGTRRLRTIGSDLGNAIGNFKNAVGGDPEEKRIEELSSSKPSNVGDRPSSSQTKTTDKM
jgi:sec-independent protein translocase protein TatA